MTSRTPAPNTMPLRTQHEQLLFAILQSADEIATAMINAVRQDPERWASRDADDKIWARVDAIVVTRLPQPPEES